MKVTKACLGLMVILFIVSALAGCSGSSQQGTSSPGVQTTPATGGAQQSTGGGSTSGSTAAQALGTVNYNWVEYKMTSGAGAQQMVMYMKVDKQKGTCSIRVEGQNIPGMTGQEMPCGQSTGGQARSDPNQVSPSVSWTYVGTESVTVPAGTFMASKYTATIQGVQGSEGSTATYWVVKGTPLVKMVTSTATSGGQVSSTMELNGWG
jgi:hypothetical protein